VSYQWLNSSNVIAGAVTANYTVSSAGYYRVIISNVYGCSDTSSADTVIVHSLPLPVITTVGNTLTTGGYISYQWAYNGTDIIGATSNSYTATVTTGIYTVTVTDTNGCAGTSAPFDASTLNIVEVKGPDNMVIYPNPATGILHIDAPMPVNATLFVPDGRIVGKYLNTKEIDLTPLPDGIYLIRVTDAAGNLQRIKMISKQANR
jgi:hypothetical protein